MRKSITALSFFLAASLVAATSVEAQKKSGGPRMEIEPEEYDFGSVQQDEKLVHEFAIHNTGDEVLEIRRISTTCGCTAALTADKSVAPGESTTLRVTLETRKYRGTIERSVSVASNDPRRVHTVHVKAFVEPKEE